MRLTTADGVSIVERAAAESIGARTATKEVEHVVIRIARLGGSIPEERLIFSTSTEQAAEFLNAYPIGSRVRIVSARHDGLWGQGPLQVIGLFLRSKALEVELTDSPYQPAEEGGDDE